MKAWERAYSRRPPESRSTRIVLILCEDSKTAPLYFEQFPYDKQDVELRIIGTGTNTETLVRAAIQAKIDAENKGEKYIAIWCVFDRDSFPAHNFNVAIELGKRHGIQIAYANQCFELWYWLHFDFQQTAVSRHDYADKLSGRLGRKYSKTDPSIYKDLLPLQSQAIRNAKKLLSCYSPCCPQADDPSTTVHLLVEYLNEFSTT